MNLPEDRLSDALKLLPSEKSPTVNHLADISFVAVEVILEVIQARDLVPKLKRIGGSGIFTYPLNQVIP